MDDRHQVRNWANLEVLITQQIPHLKFDHY